jgi:hypothetical protein
VNDSLGWAVLIVILFLIGQLIAERYTPPPNHGSRESDRTFWDDDDGGDE